MERERPVGPDRYGDRRLKNNSQVTTLNKNIAVKRVFLIVHIKTNGTGVTIKTVKSSNNKC